MDKTLSRTLSITCLNSRKTFQGWQMAIDEAEKQISEANQRVASLRRSIQTFTALRDSGAAFPETLESQREDMGQKGDLGQSRIVESLNR